MQKKIKVAIAGVGNCASALVQGVEYYRSRRNAALLAETPTLRERIESHVLLLSYDHLSPPASLVRSSPKGVEEGATASTQPQPPPPAPLSISEQLKRDWYRSIGRA